MDFAHPLYLLLFLPAAAALWWFDRRSLRPLSPRRRRTLLAVRMALVALVLLALAGPAVRRASQSEAVIFVLDHSQSQGESGRATAYEEVRRLTAGLGRGTPVGFVSAGLHSHVLAQPEPGTPPPPPDPKLMTADGQQTDLAAAVALATALFPPGKSKHLVLVGDGQETVGDLASAAREAALRGATIDALPVAGQQRPDVRVVRLVSNKSCSHEGASFELRADIESSLAGKGRLRLFENGIEVESRELKLAVGDQVSETFRRRRRTAASIPTPSAPRGSKATPSPRTTRPWPWSTSAAGPSCCTWKASPTRPATWPTPWRRRGSACRSAGRTPSRRRSRNWPATTASS